jgi:hypothetical protein
MGAAHEHRGNSVIRRQADEASASHILNEQVTRACVVTEECDEFTRAALSVLADPGGLRSRTVSAMRNRRGWPKRAEALRKAHADWLEFPQDAFARCEVSLNRARAAYSLLVYALGTFTIPDRVHVPATVRR